MWLVRCRRCLRRRNDLWAAPVVAELDTGYPHWVLTPVRNWSPGGIGGRGIYTLTDPVRDGTAVPLTCTGCGNSCGAWKARTLADRLLGTDGRALLVPDLPAGRDRDRDR